jgi:glycerate dehydrogenase
MKIVLLDALTFGDTPLGCFEQFGEVSIYDKTAPEKTQERITNADVIVTNKVVITKEHILSCPTLKLICIAATGMNNVDLEAAKELGVEVKNVAGYSTDSVIQHTFSILFYLIGHSRYYDESVKDKRYSRSGLFSDVSHPFFEIKGKKWGIIGLGSIGRGVAKVASAFGAEISYYSTSGIKRDEPYPSSTLEEILQQSDIISIHAPLNDKTLNLLGYEQLLMCKEKSVVLNLGRGGIIDEEAVAKIIDQKDIKIGLDVFSQEPLDENSPLLGVKNKENLYMTPHIAWTSQEARKKLIESVCRNIEDTL